MLWGLYSVCFSDLETAYAAGRSATILKTGYGGTTSTHEIKPRMERLVINPNPASDRITITSPGLENENILLTIFSMTGEVVLTKAFWFHKQAELDISPLPEGIYIVKLVGVKGVQVGKFVKQ
jgi:hypothetical protein